MVPNRVTRITLISQTYYLNGFDEDALGEGVRKGPGREISDLSGLEVKGWCRIAQTYILLASLY